MENKLSTEEQLYCLQYEFETLSEFVTKGYVERWVHNYIPSQVAQEHIERYYYACKHTENKKVLDIAGGSGYGTFLLATEGKAKEVCSVDIDESAVRYANLKYTHFNIDRKVGDAVSYIKDNYYDLIVSFETVEHLNDYNAFLNNIYQSLKSNGELIISTPIVSATTTNNINKFHVIEWSLLDFQHLIKNKFEIKEIYVQNIYLKSDFKHSLITRIKRKLLSQPHVPREKIAFEKYTGQYQTNEIVRGYQLIHCIKK